MMLTVIETPTFSRLAADYWSEDERGEFVAWIAQHPDAGDVITGSGGCRKVRWTRKGMGKRGGVRIIYFNRLENGEVWLLLIYAKNVRPPRMAEVPETQEQCSGQESIPGNILRKIKEEIENA